MMFGVDMDWQKIAILSTLMALSLYLLPFALGPLVQILSPVWGFIVGRRRRRTLIDAKFPTAERSENVLAGDQAQKLMDNEFKYLESARQEKESILKEKVKEITEKKENIEEAHKRHKEAMRETLPAKALQNVIAKFNRETGKNLLLLLGVIALLFVDTLIARQIFISLGLLVSDSIEFLEHQVQYTTIYGVFLTTTLATLLHLVWPRKRFKTFFSENKWSLLIGVGALAIFFVVRLLTVLVPDTAQRLMEVLMLSCWIIGVVGVYWLIGEIVGDESDWFRLVIAIAAPLLVVLLILFGGVIIVHGILEFAFTKSIESWLGLRRARAVKQERNALEASYGVKRGFYRGFTL